MEIWKSIYKHTTSKSDASLKWHSPFKGGKKLLVVAHSIVSMYVLHRF